MEPTIYFIWVYSYGNTDIHEYNTYFMMKNFKSKMVQYICYVGHTKEMAENYFRNVTRLGILHYKCWSHILAHWNSLKSLKLEKAFIWSTLHFQVDPSGSMLKVRFEGKDKTVTTQVCNHRMVRK